MQNPADLLQDAAVFSTNAVVNTETSTVLVAAPGLLSRIRIWGWCLSLRPNATGKVRAYIRPGAANQIFGIAGLSGGANGQLGMCALIPGGFPCPANDTVTFRHESNVASQSLAGLILYTIEKTG